MNHSEASIVLYSAGPPASGKRFGINPSDAFDANVRNTPAASAARPVASSNPGSAIIVSRPQSVNHG